MAELIDLRHQALTGWCAPALAILLAAIVADLEVRQHVHPVERSLLAQGVALHGAGPLAELYRRALAIVDSLHGAAS